MATGGGEGPARGAGPAGARALALRLFCQQAAEKAAKAFLTFHRIAFRKTHDLKDLGLQCVTADPSLGPTFEDAEELTDYASAFRYPDAPYEPDAAEAAEALKAAARLCDEVQRRIESVLEP